jgi:hypothetical protein
VRRAVAPPLPGNRAPRAVSASVDEIVGDRSIGDALASLTFPPG